MSQLQIPASRKDLLWLSCREKTCCYATKVVLSGLDLWRIHQAMELMPWQYTLYSDAPEDAVDGFRLVPGGPLFQVVLAKRGEIGQYGAPCIFLLKLSDGHAQCGLGALKPTACRAYPAALVDNLLRCESSACTCRRWSLLDLDAEQDTSMLNEMLSEMAEYSEIVAAWNNLLHEGHEPRSYHDFCSYVLAAYDALRGGTL